MLVRTQSPLSGEGKGLIGAGEESVCRPAVLPQADGLRCLRSLSGKHSSINVYKERIPIENYKAGKEQG